MNVLRENVYTSKGLHGRRRRTIPAEVTKNPLPKYRFETGEPKNLVNLGPTNSNTFKTPSVNQRRVPTSTSSSTRRGTSSSNTATNRTAGSSSATDDTNIILAITAGRGDARTEVGMAAIDIQYPYMILCQISDLQTYMDTLTKIYIFNPIEIIMPDTMCHDKNKLYASIKERFRGLPINPISRFHFNEKAGLERIQKHCCTAYSPVILFVKQKYYALAATSALLKYVEYIQHIVYGSKCMRIEFQGSPNCAVIDIESAEKLELVVSQGNDPKICLLGALDHCLTPMGRRSLRVSVLQPPCCEEAILERQNCVSELVTNHSLRTVLQPVIRRLYGADRLLNMGVLRLHSSTVQNAERNLNYVLLLKNCLDVVPELRAALTCAQSSYYEQVRKNLDNKEFVTMREKILKIIHEDARWVMGYTSANAQRCFAIRTGINDLLDVARRTYCELIADMKSMVEDLGKRYNLPMSLACNATLGYHIQVDGSRCRQFKETDFHQDFTQIQRRRNGFTMTTLGLLAMSNQCKMSYDEIHIMSDVILTNLISDIKEHIGFLFQLSSDVAELDLIASLAQVSTISGFVKPTFGSQLQLEDSVHPIMKIFNTTSNVIPNDVRASIPYNFHLITGPNMSGKSVYIKQVVLTQIMAQIGCYVLATKAEVRIADRILCRISFRDDIECQASTFTLEMKEAQYILQSVTPHSLVILDEPCRATAVEEGASIAIALCEKLFSTSAFIFCATHFTHLTKLADIYFNVTNHCFKVITEEIEGCDRPRIIYTHKLVIGEAPTNNYGIELARMSGLPEAILAKAYNVIENLNSRKNPVDKNTGPEVEERVISLKKRYDFFAGIFLRHNKGQDICNLIADLVKDLSIDVDKERAEARNFQKRTVDDSQLINPNIVPTVKSLESDLLRNSVDNGTETKKSCEVKCCDKTSSKVEAVSGNVNKNDKTVGTTCLNELSKSTVARTSEIRLSQEFGTEKVKRTIAKRELKLQKIRHVVENLSQTTFSETDSTPFKMPRYECDKKNAESDSSYYNTQRIFSMNSNKTDNISDTFKHDKSSSRKDSSSTEPRESSNTSSRSDCNKPSTSSEVPSSWTREIILPDQSRHISLKSCMSERGVKNITNAELPNRKHSEMKISSSSTDFPKSERITSQQLFSSVSLVNTSFNNSNVREHAMESTLPTLGRVNAIMTASQNKNKEAQCTITSRTSDKILFEKSSKTAALRSLQFATESEREDTVFQNSVGGAIQQNVSINTFDLIAPINRNPNIFSNENEDNHRYMHPSASSSFHSQEFARAMFNEDSQYYYQTAPINTQKSAWPNYLQNEFHNDRQSNPDSPLRTTVLINEVGETSEISTQPRHRQFELFSNTDRDSPGKMYRNSSAQCSSRSFNLDNTVKECPNSSSSAGEYYIVSPNYFVPSISKMTTASNFSSDESEPSQIARYNARAKEAEIFRIIEGDAFNEEEFFRS